jgi:tetratricopeptide (TPR) repeat protein
MKRLLVLSLCGGLATSPSSVALQAPPPDSELERGVLQAQRGAFDAAVITLDAVARDLAAEGGHAQELARAYVYLSIAYLGLSQRQKAKANFLEALRIDSDLELSTREYPPRILEFFEETRREARATLREPEAKPASREEAARPSGDAEAGETVPPPPEPEEGRGKRRLLLVGAGVVVLAGVAAAASRKIGICDACTSDGECPEGAVCAVFADDQSRCASLETLNSNSCAVSCEGVGFCR